MNSPSHSEIALNLAKQECRLRARQNAMATRTLERPLARKEAYSDTDLVYRLLLGQAIAPTARHAEPRGERVCRQFAIMESSARRICVRHGFDPDEWVRKD